MKIEVEKEVIKTNRAQRLVVKTLTPTSNKDEEKSGFHDIFEEMF